MDEDEVHTDSDEEVQPRSILEINRQLWLKERTKPGTNPYKNKVYGAYRPLPTRGLVPLAEATPSFRPGRMMRVFDGLEIARSTGVNRLAKQLITLKRGLPLAGQFEQYQPALDSLVLVLLDDQKKAEEATARIQAQKAATAAGAASSGAAGGGGARAGGGGAAPLRRVNSAPTPLLLTDGNRRQRRAVSGVGPMDQYARQEDPAFTVAHATEQFEHDVARLFVGLGMPYSIAGHVLFHRVFHTAFECGKRQYSIQPFGVVGRQSTLDINLPSPRQISGRLLDAIELKYPTKMDQRVYGLHGTIQLGFGWTSDGSRRHNESFINNAILLPPDRDQDDRFQLEVIYWDMTATGSIKKLSGENVARMLYDSVKSDRMPHSSMHLILISLDGGEVKAFEPIEKLFLEDAESNNAVVRWCPTHAIQLALASMADIDGIDAIIPDVRFVVTFVTSHKRPTAILASISSFGLIKWNDTRFATIFLVFQRVQKLRAKLESAIVDSRWIQYQAAITTTDMKDKVERCVDYLRDRSFWAKITKTLGLIEPLFVFLRYTDSDQPTLSIEIEFWNEMGILCGDWGGTKFDPVDGVPAFDRSQCSLLCNGNTVSKKTPNTKTPKNSLFLCSQTLFRPVVARAHFSSLPPIPP